jgi:hypothetical protein
MYKRGLENLGEDWEEKKGKSTINAWHTTGRYESACREEEPLDPIMAIGLLPTVTPRVTNSLIFVISILIMH